MSRQRECVIIMQTSNARPEPGQGELTRKGWYAEATKGC